MIKLTTAEAMQKAIDKARRVKPLVRVVDFGSLAGAVRRRNAGQ